MNKAIQKLMMALAICGALCGTAMAYPPNAVRAERLIESEGIAERSECRAPRGNPPPKGRAPTAMRASAPKGHTVNTTAPARHTAKHHATPAKHHAPRHEIVRHAPPPPPPPPRRGWRWQAKNSPPMPATLPSGGLIASGRGCIPPLAPDATEGATGGVAASATRTGKPQSCQYFPPFRNVHIECVFPCVLRKFLGRCIDHQGDNMVY